MPISQSTLTVKELRFVNQANFFLIKQKIKVDYLYFDKFILICFDFSKLIVYICKIS